MFSLFKVRTRIKTIGFAEKHGKIQYDLKVKNYNKLIGTQSYGKQILIADISSQEEYKGIIQPELLTRLENTLSVGKYHQVTLQKTVKIKRMTGKEKIEYTLIDLKELQDFEES